MIADAATYLILAEEGDSEGATLAVAGDTATLVADGGVGPRGAAGPAGESAFDIWAAAGNVGTEADFLASLRGTVEGDALVRLAGAVALSGHRVVRFAADGARYVSVDDLSHADTAIGITTGASAAGAMALIQTSGLLTEPSWNWAPGPVFAGLDGMLTQTPPRAAFEQRVGTSVGPTRILVEVEAAFILAT